MADVIDTSEFRNGLKILIDNEPFVIVEFQHVKPGKGSAFVRTRYKSLITGRTLEKNFKSGAMKPATLETGYSLQVPLFINEGDILKIDTRTGEYLTRVG